MDLDITVVQYGRWWLMDLDITVVQYGRCWSMDLDITVLHTVGGGQWPLILQWCIR
jgi:hypothetical protein